MFTTNKTQQTGVRPINEIAREIEKEWKNVNYAARPYLDAMHSLVDKNSRYIADSATSIVAYFLSNATTWRGEAARRIKAELNKIIK